MRISDWSSDVCSSDLGALDRKKPFVAVSAEGSYNDKTEKWSPKGSIDFSTRLGEDIGISGELSYYRRRFATDGVEAGGWKVADDGTAFARSEEHTSELQSLMRTSYAVVCLQKKKSTK